MLDIFLIIAFLIVAFGVMLYAFSIIDDLKSPKALKSARKKGKNEIKKAAKNNKKRV